MKRHFILLALALLSSCAGEIQHLRANPTALVQEDPTAPLARRMAQLQEDLIREEITGSNAALVYRQGDFVYEGSRNSGKAGDADITQESLFPIWSMTKPITIAAMLTLHEQGLFNWEDPVSKYMPCFAELSVRDGNSVRPATEPLRIVHLMSHRSGYTYYSGSAPATYGLPAPSQTAFSDLQQFVEAAARTPLRFEPGSAYAYGISQAILGRLIEVLSEKSFAEYLEQALFKPLGMADTSFVLDAERRARFQPLYINVGALQGFTNLLDGLNYHPQSRAHFGGEGLVSSMADYARFCEMLVSGGMFRGRRILSEKSLATMTSPWTEDYFPAGMPGYDLGFSVYVLAEPGLEGNKAPKGIYGWSAYHNTHFWIDPASEMFVVFMTRAREFSFELPRRLRVAVYGEAE